jgi:hypothetical protein
MHVARAGFPKRNRLLTGGALLLLAALLVLVRAEHTVRPGGKAIAPVAGAPAVPLAGLTPDNARRAAVAALGPIKRRGGVNAADFYKQAIGLYAGLTEREKDILLHREHKADPKVAAALYAKIQPIMDLLRRGRKADYADWGLGPKTTLDAATTMAQVNSILNLGIVAQWDASYRFASDPDGAVSDLAAMDAVARSGYDSFIGFIEGNSLHMGAMTLLAQNAGGITAASESDLAYIISTAAAEQSFRDGVNGEAAMLQAMLDEYFNPATRAQAEPYLANSKAVSDMQWLERTEQELAGTLQQPETQFQQWLTQKQAEAASKPVAAPVITLLGNVRHIEQMSAVDNAMFAAGMAVEQNNQGQYQSIADPATGQPFTYTQTANGFQLGSALLQRPGKPMSMSFSTPAGK